MSEKDKIGKVIAGLRRCTRMPMLNDDCTGIACPYYDRKTGCVQALMRDALTVLLIVNAEKEKNDG